MAEGRVRGFSIATKCATVDELIEKYRDRVDELSILVNTVESREIGTECAFAILLSDKRVAIAGTCIVMNVFTDTNNPFKRTGMRLGIKRLGPDSESVWAQLIAMRTKSVTPPSPVATVPRSPRPQTGRAQTVFRGSAPTRARADSPVAETTSDTAPRYVTIPPRNRRNTDLTRAPRATPSVLEYTQKPPKRKPESRAPYVVEAEGSGDPVAPAAMAVPKPMPEQRTPGSTFILPANPFMNLTDASLEGFVDCKLDEALGLTPPDVFPNGTHEEPPPREAAPIAAAPSGLVAVPTYVEPMKSEPLPLPPPPPARPSQVMTAEAYRASELPRLALGSENDTGVNARPRLVSRRWLQLTVAITLVPLLGAAAVVAYMQFFALPAANDVPAAPVTVATLDEPTQARAAVEPAPAAPIEEEPAVPAKQQPIHAVLVKSYPIAARVTVGGRYFGTTPTYVKIPANTPVEVHIVRPGFKPVTYPLVSKKRTDRVFVKLQRRGGRR